MADQRRDVACVGEADEAGRRIVEAGDHGDEQTEGAGLAELAVDQAQEIGGLPHRPDQAAVEARGLRHQQRRPEPLAGHVADVEADATVVQSDDVVEVAGDHPRRGAHAVDREILVPRLRQHALLDQCRQVELLGHALLPNEALRRSRAEKSEARGSGQHLQDLQILRCEVRARAEPIDQLDRSQTLAVDDDG